MADEDQKDFPTRRITNGFEHLGIAPNSKELLIFELHGPVALEAYRKGGMPALKIYRQGGGMAAVDAYCEYMRELELAKLRQASPLPAQREQAPKPTSWPKYRSVLKRAIQVVLIQSPDANDMAIARELDRLDCEVPKRWRRAGTFVGVYRDPAYKHSFETIISAVRRDLKSKA